MNTYSFEECQIGKRETFKTKITAERMAKFLEITGDINPLHNNEHFAKERGFNDRVVYGLLTTAYCSTLGGIFTW